VVAQGEQSISPLLVAEVGGRAMDIKKSTRDNIENINILY